jgi:hypothetical protein
MDRAVPMNQIAARRCGKAEDGGRSLFHLLAVAHGAQAALMAPTGNPRPSARPNDSRNTAEQPGANRELTWIDGTSPEPWREDCGGRDRHR